MAKLTDVCDIQYGYAFDSGCFTDDDSYPQLVRIRDVKRGFSETYYSGEYPEDYVLNAGDLLVGMDGEFNIARWKVEGALLNQRVCKIVARPDTDEEYLRFVLGKALKAIEDRTSFATVKHLSAKELNKLELDLPKYEEQVHRSTVLAKLEAIIEQRQYELDKLDELIKARFVESFDNGNYPKIRLGDACKKITDGTHKTPNYIDEGITFISAKNIVNGELDFSDVKHISEEEYQEIQKRCQTEKNDILLSKSGSLGAPVIVRTEEKIGLFESLAVLKYERDRFLPEFLCEQLKTDMIQRQFTTGTKGVAIKHLHLGVIADTEIIEPPVKEQKAFADFVKQVDKSKSAVRKALNETQLIFDSLMQEYFG